MSYFNANMKSHKQQLVAASPLSRTKRWSVVLKALVPTMLGWKAAQWMTADKYLDEATANGVVSSNLRKFRQLRQNAYSQDPLCDHADDKCWLG